MKNVQISYDLFVALVEYHLGYDDEYEDESGRDWSRSWTP